MSDDFFDIVGTEHQPIRPCNIGKCVVVVSSDASIELPESCGFCSRHLVLCICRDGIKQFCFHAEHHPCPRVTAGTTPEPAENSIESSVNGPATRGGKPGA